MQALNITVLCKVVDNYGDIGVAHRLCMELAALCAPSAKGGQGGSGVSLRLVVNCLSAYNAISPAVRAVPVQEANGITVLDWNDEASCRAEYAARPPCIILQCFQCGYPKWLEDMLFNSPLEHDVAVIEVDYLTAEAWAEDFHKMASLTRRAKVHKSLFMPGFTAKTGGLLMAGRTRPDATAARPRRCTILVFCYERGYSSLVAAISRFNRENPVCVYAANGAGQKAFLNAWEEAKRPFKNVALPLIPQEEWDKMLLGVDIAFVRGEDSLAGAALGGMPFVWQAYKQEGGAHIKKVEALLCLMEKHFSKAQYALLSRLWLIWNTEETGTEEEAECLYEFISQHKAFEAGFARCASSLKSNGDMAENLLEYIKEMQSSMTGMLP